MAAKNWALVIGINQYDFLQPLNYAKRDAQLIQEFLCNEAGFEKVFFFSDDSPDISGKSTRPYRANLLRILRQLFEKPFMEAGDNFWFFFSGHGMRHNDRDYLMPSDGDPGDIENTAISINFVTERLRRCGADNVVLILDACRSQGTRAGEGIGRQTASMAHQTGVISIFSCSPNEYSYEIDALQQGAFTRALLDGLGIQGKCATVERLNQYLSLRVPELVRQHKNARQTPYIIAEPVDKLHLILVPRYATLADIATLKIDAFKAEANRNLELAEQLWLRVNAAASGTDMDAIKALQRIAQIRPSMDASPSPSSATQNSSSPNYTPNPSPAVKRRGKSKSPTAAPTNQPASNEYIVKSPQTNDPNSERGVDHTQLRDLLKAEQWKEADQKTLAVMLKASSSPAFPVLEFEVVTVDVHGNESNRYRGQVQYFTEDLGNGVTLEMVDIPGGTFLMGSPENEERRLPNEGPQHSVNIKPFLMGKYPITQAHWKTVASFPKVNRDLELDPSHFKGANLPVEQVSWHDAVEFCARLSSKTGREYRLPTEAEWEYACRAETKTPFHFGETITPKLANYDCNYSYRSRLKGTFRNQTSPVGSFPFANAFGLFDMHGLVCEWCLDDWHESYNYAPTDGSAWLTDTKNNLRVLRGGSWYNDPRDCRSAFRYKRDSDDKLNRIGFRIVCTLMYTA
ncbi:hypothetical protein NIES4075_67120 [Tolypothrix sp. NIES-4075]|uniref:SUMF1/EgtB/PvdO family nonheme iron enzyme n=1 Tax=Tolypothrix sp. NIES-4075 TaxID=2005459 RepID=UPI000B5CE823|nr:SUMF1/EgtB/PvdO family nonheme iron enzyme [Tolypothrix sp. NIES-4075]GAX45691.1 hypothetical protein NIES4075_67120 [Tolypothrix sp. NIES-4075]